MRISDWSSDVCSSDLGRATALACAAEGAEVLATDIDIAHLEELAGTPGIAVRRLDVLDAQAVNSLAAELPPLDVLCNIAGYVHHGSVLDCPEEDWDFSFDLNVKAMYRMIRAFQIGRAHVGTPVTNAQLVCRLL